MNKMMSTLTNENFSSRTINFAFIGANFLFRKGQLKGHRLAFEFGKLVSYKVADYQLAPSETITLGWQKTL
jgi:hypothetical protein